MTKGYVLFVSPVPWDGIKQRPHALAREINLQTGLSVIWVNPYPSRLPKLGDVFRYKSRSLCSSPAPDWISVIKPFALPVEPIPILNSINSLFWAKFLNQVSNIDINYVIVLKPCNLALSIAKVLPNSVIIFDALDDFPFFYSGLSRRHMIFVDLKVSKMAKIIHASSTYLFGKYKSINGAKVKLTRNAHNLVWLSDDTKISNAHNEKIIIGFIGTIGFWFDWDAIVSIANMSPNFCIEIIGPVFEKAPSHIPKNIHFLGALDADRMRAHLNKFSIGLIPFLECSLTRGVDPIKYYEYKSLGIPIVSSLFGEMSLRKNESGVFLYENMSELKLCIESALAYKCEIEETRTFREENTWSKRFKSYLAANEL